MHNITNAFKGKTLVITGGTGSFGSTVLKHFLTSDIGEIRIISRDEKKQDTMRHVLQAKYPGQASKVSFYVGDVRNIDSVRDVMQGADYVFHAAALKEVPSCEFFPMEAVRTNIIGTDNVITAAVENKVKRVVFLSTDKAAYPINSMGMTKAVGEKVVAARAQKAFERGGTVLACTRYGNVMCSRGSVIPLFIDQIKGHRPITITDPNMTRFLMNLDEAVDLVVFAFEHAEPGDLFIQKADASTIGALADGVMKVFGQTEKKIIGTRHGEKLYETLMTREERLRSVDMGHYFRIAPDGRSLNYDKFYVEGQVQTESDEAYTSHNTHLLDVDGVVNKIMGTDYVKEELEEYCSSSDFVFNLAGVNRPKDPAEFRAGNFGFAGMLLDTLKKCGNYCPVMLSSSVQASLTGRFGDSEYGRSKRAGEELFFSYAAETGSRVLVYRFPNLFGKWCRPHYNSAVATFCHAVANDEEYTVNDRSTELELLYIDDLVNGLLEALAGRESRCDYNGLELVENPEGRYCYISAAHRVTLGQIVDLLESFRSQPNTLFMPDQTEGSFSKKLYATYLSYLPPSKTVYDLHMNIVRGGVSLSSSARLPPVRFLSISQGRE